MTSYLVLQANPKLYDIDGSRQQLGEIVWRTPHYTGSVVARYGAMLWRSGHNDGIVGVGRITASPAQRATPESELSFIIDGAVHLARRPATAAAMLRVVPAHLEATADKGLDPGE
jgi:hypothetical protein